MRMEGFGEMLYRSIKLPIQTSKTDRKRIEICNKESALVWNYCISINNDRYKETGKFYSKLELQKFVKNITTSIACASTKQIVSHRVAEAFVAVSVARRSGRVDENYPHKEKNYYVSEWSYQFMKCDYAKNEIKLTTAQYKREDGRKKNGTPIKIKFKYPIPHNIVSLKIVYQDRKYFACIIYKISEIFEGNSVDKNVSAIDLGEIHAITSLDNNANQAIFIGRKLRSTKRFRNKKLSELQQKMGRCRKGSRQWEKYHRSLMYIILKTQKQLHYQTHKLTRMYTDWAVEKGISTVFCGDVADLDRGMKQKGKGNKNVRQKLTQWEYGKIMKLLEYKLRYVNIDFRIVDEAYTSQICPSCGYKHKPRNRNFLCPYCGESHHRDIVGAYNILRLNTIVDFLPHNKTMYLRIS